jgi:hypothetical protein
MRRRLELLLQLEEISTKRNDDLSKEESEEGRVLVELSDDLLKRGTLVRLVLRGHSQAHATERLHATKATFQQDCRIALISGVVPAGTLGSFPSSRTASATCSRRTTQSVNVEELRKACILSEQHIGEVKRPYVQRLLAWVGIASFRAHFDQGYAIAPDVGLLDILVAERLCSKWISGW